MPDAPIQERILVGPVDNNKSVFLIEFSGVNIFHLDFSHHEHLFQPHFPEYHGITMREIEHRREIGMLLLNPWWGLVPASTKPKQAETFMTAFPLRKVPGQLLRPLSPLGSLYGHSTTSPCSIIHSNAPQSLRNGHAAAAAWSTVCLWRW
jgi:hypothetical protein